MRALLALGILISGGCLAAPVEPGGYTLQGAFTREATSADHEEVARIVRDATGAEIAILESFPPQFVVRGLGAAACEKAHAELAGKRSLGRLDACRPDAAPAPAERST